MTVMDGEGASTGAARTMRSDAQRSERVLVRAGTAAIHREGMHVPLGTIALVPALGSAPCTDTSLPARPCWPHHLPRRAHSQAGK